jgi:hypothetical protein
MLYGQRRVRGCGLPLFVLPLFVLPLFAPLRAIAAPAKVFLPHLERIQQRLPPRFVMRLPQEILLGGPADTEFIEELTVRVLVSPVPQGLTVGLYSCETEAPQCLVGTFTVMRADSAIAQREFQQYLAGATPIQLTNSIRGYVRDLPSRRLPIMTSSVMWEQEGMFYTIRFAAPERQNMLYMAVSMANNQPIYALNPTLRDIPARKLDYFDRKVAFP